MFLFIAKRIVLMLPLLLGISVVSFVLTTLSPSDPAEVALRVNDITPTAEAIVQMREALGLDKPLHVRYISWLLAVMQGNFGVSYVTRTPVWDEILHALPTTLLLASSAFMLIVVFGLVLGIVCAVYEERLVDKLIRGSIFIATAMPSFWLGLLFIWFFALYLDWLPTSGLEHLSGIILPTITLSLTYIGTYIRLMRNTMIQSKHELYVLYAKARGLKESVIIKHRVMNALQPFMVALGMSIPKLVAGTVIVENIFGLPGVGRVCVSAIFSRDYPMIQAYVLFMAVLFILFNLLADLSIKLIDPRLRRAL